MSATPELLRLHIDSGRHMQFAIIIYKGAFIVQIRAKIITAIIVRVYRIANVITCDCVIVYIVVNPL